MNVEGIARHAKGLGIKSSQVGKRHRQHHFEEDGSDDDDGDRKSGKEAKKDLGHLGFAQSENKIMEKVLGAQKGGVMRYGGKDAAKWEDDNEKLEAFNLKEELEEGHINEDGVYVENGSGYAGEQGDPRDAWLEDFQERQGGELSKESKAAAEAEAKALKAMMEAEEAEEQDPGEARLEAAQKLVEHLLPKESVARALKRLRKEKEKFAVVTDNADKLLGLGIFEIYSQTKEMLAAKIEASLDTAKAAKAAKEEKATAGGGSSSWEYKIKRTDEAVHGPFSSEDMTAWLAEGYFRGDSAVWVRRVGDGTGSYQKSDEVAKFD